MNSTEVSLKCILYRNYGSGDTEDDTPYIARELGKFPGCEILTKVGEMRIECDKKLWQLAKLAQMEEEIYLLIQSAFWDGARYQKEQKSKKKRC